MIVRCGRCRVDLEVAGPGEFMCPNCGTRNAVRGPAQQPANPFGLPDLGAPSAPVTNDPPEGIRWVRCPGCSYRFALGDVAEVDCPACSRHLVVSEEGLHEAASG